MRGRGWQTMGDEKTSTERLLENLFYGTVTVGERGQIVIPAEARSQEGIEPGDKLLVFAHPGRGGLSILKMSNIREFARALEAAMALAQQDTHEEDSDDASE